MGSNLSTLSSITTHVVDNMSRETMIGVLLAIPFFVQYFKQHMDAFKKDPSQVVSTLKGMSTLQYYSEQDAEIRVVKHRSLMSGIIPPPEPSSEDSIATEKISNHKSNKQAYAEVDTIPPPTEVIIKVSSTKAAEEISMEPVPVLAVEPVRRSAPCVTPEKMAPTMPAVGVELERSVPCVTPEAPSPLSTSFKSTPSKFPDTVTVMTPETSGETDMEEDTSEESSSSVSKPTCEYLESVSRSLARRARKCSHSDKVGIAQAIVELGNILLKDDAYKSAMNVFKRAEVIQKIIVDETIASVASAMKQQSDYHTKHGNLSLANLYGNMAMDLGSSPSPANLKKCMDLHYDHKPHGHVDKDFASLVRKLDRRLKRAGAEAAPLVATLKKQALVARLR